VSEEAVVAEEILAAEEVLAVEVVAETTIETDEPDEYLDDEDEDAKDIESSAAGQ
jgi:hypothetical protein